METFRPEEARKAEYKFNARIYRRFFSCGNNIKQQAERKGSACCFSTSINARLHKKSRNMGVRKGIGSPIGGIDPLRAFILFFTPASPLTSRLPRFPCAHPRAVSSSPCQLHPDTPEFPSQNPRQSPRAADIRSLMLLQLPPYQS